MNKKHKFPKIIKIKKLTQQPVDLSIILLYFFFILHRNNTLLNKTSFFTFEKYSESPSS